MVRSYVRNAIFSALNYDIFRYEDFNFEERPMSKGDLITISYDTFFYKMNFNDSDSKCEISICPGNILMKESEIVSIGNFEQDIPNSIRKWLSRIKSELLNPVEKRFVSQELQDFKDILDDRLRKVEDSFFSTEEKEDLLKRLDMLEKMILNEAMQKEELSKEINKIKNEIEFLKSTVDKLTRKKWIKNAFLKIWEWGQDPKNAKLIEAGLNTIEKISNIEIQCIGK